MRVLGPSLAVLLVLGGVFLFVAYHEDGPLSPPGWLAATGTVAVLALFAWGWYRFAFSRQPAPPQGVATARRDGSFEWRPANEPKPFVPGRSLVHRAWEGGATVQADVVIEIPDETTERALKAALKRGLAAATDALPARGHVRVQGELRDVVGPTSRFRARLVVRGHGAQPAWARLAAEAFAAAFVHALARKGFASDVR